MNAFPVCCSHGKYYNISTKSCVKDCKGYISLKVLCVPLGSYVDFSGSLSEPVLKSKDTYCNGILMPLEMTVCCPKSHYVGGINGCTYCEGNIFGVTDYQVCCAKNEIYNPVTKKCIRC